MTSNLKLALGAVVGLAITIGLFIFVLASFRHLYGEIASARSELAAVRAQSLVASDMVVAIQDGADIIAKARIGIDGLCLHSSNSRDIWPQCSKFYSYDNHVYLNFLAQYSGVVGERVRADSPADYAKLEQDYANLVPVIHEAGQSGAARQWEGRLWEGVAYARLQQGKLPQAEDAVTKAIGLDPGSAFAGLTSIKIDCAQNKPAAAIGNAFAALGQRLQANLGKANSVMDRRDAGLELSYYNGDDDIIRRCHYAGLKR